MQQMMSIAQQLKKEKESSLAEVNKLEAAMDATIRKIRVSIQEMSLTWSPILKICFNNTKVHMIYDIFI